MKRLLLHLLCLGILALIGYGYGAWQREGGLVDGIAIGRGICSMALDDCQRLAVEAIAEADSCCERGRE